MDERIGFMMEIDLVEDGDRFGFMMDERIGFMMEIDLVEDGDRLDL